METKVKFVCVKCKKPVELKKSVFDKKEKKLCRACSIQETKLNYSDERKQEILQKRIKTCKKRYGTTNGGASEQAKQKQKETLIKNYGSVKAGYKHHQEKRAQTLLKKYGVDNNAKRDDVKIKTKQTLIDKHGSVENAYKERLKAIQNTMMEKYGVTTNLVFVKFKKYGYQNVFFDSSWELAYWIWLKDHNIEFRYHEDIIEYMNDKGDISNYYPDFIVDGKIHEIKGDHFFDKEGRPYDLYHKCFWYNKYNLILEKGGKILRHKDIKQYLDYVKKKYGKNFLKSCKIVK